MSTSDAVQRAIELAKQGKRDEARDILKGALNLDRDNARAWAAMSQLAQSRKEAEICLKQVLRLVPDNTWAEKRLRHLQQSAPQPALVPPPEVPPQRAKKPGPSTAKTARTLIAVIGGIIVVFICIFLCVAAGVYVPSSAPTLVPQPTVATWLTPAASVEQLALLSSRGSESPGGGYFEVQGQVKNISDAPLEDVVAVVTVYDHNHEFIASDNALIDFNPLLPGQTSPYKVMVSYNPWIEYYAVEFQFLFGGKIRTRDDRPPPPGSEGAPTNSQPWTD